MFAAMLGSAIIDGPLGWLTNTDPAARTDRQTALDHARAQLGPDRYDAAHSTGTAMTYEQIVEYARGELDQLRAENSSPARA